MDKASDCSVGKLLEVYALAEEFCTKFEAAVGGAAPVKRGRPKQYTVGGAVAPKGKRGPRGKLTISDDEFKKLYLATTGAELAKQLKVSIGTIAKKAKALKLSKPRGRQKAK